MERNQLAFEAFKNTQELIRFIDQKAGATLAVSGILVTAFLEASKKMKFIPPASATPSEVSLFVIGAITVATLSASIWITLFNILRPRLAKNYHRTNYSPFYFDHIAVSGDKSKLHLTLRDSTSEDLLKNISDQIFETSKILRSKIKYLHASINLSAASLASLITFITISRNF